MLRRLTTFAAILCCTLLTACSTAFNREWNQALKQGPQEGVEGAWTGSWKSDVNGHHGDLRAVVSHTGNHPDHTFHYHATWMGFLSGAYRAKHLVLRTPVGYTFQGQHQMPEWAGGLYSYQGTVKGDDFRASYECSKDRGTFTLRRVR